MNLKELLQLSSDREYKKQGLSEQRLLADIDGLRNLIAFGIMGLIVIYVINPHVELIINNLTINQLRTIALTLWTIFVVDFVISTIVVYGFRKATEKANEESIGDNTEQITKMVREVLSKRSFSIKYDFIFFNVINVSILSTVLPIVIIATNNNRI